ncbi:hypothetical protein PSHT_14567 [Puccinia striiformis]|uniref:Uncharacterized protein n=3 Tax=Puccinia striiformis TaxID=27350 RepID=A0A0L0VFZ3_9BASI|nr:hypothetical protein PSTG_08578 [Puccinia striiformis f. sp. tritici PST-78]POV97458.1 hypothetical protein PSHT_14567 [Puccinia striiformis]POW17000.1 hypothetical protein PSTT_00839 [Puccinia striiformis]
MKNIQDWALKHGFAIVIKILYKVQGNHWTIFVCDKSGRYRPHRPATSCSSEVPAEAKEESSPEAPKETVSTSTKTEKDAKGTGTNSTKIKKNANTMRKTDHNHKPSDNPSAHIVHQRLIDIQKKEIIKLDASRVPALKIKNSLLEEGPLHAPLKTIHNLNHKERKKNNGGASAVEAMVTSLKSCGFTYQIQSELVSSPAASPIRSNQKYQIKLGLIILMQFFLHFLNLGSWQSNTLLAF